MSFNLWRLSAFLVGLLATASTTLPPASAATLTVTDLGDTGAPGQLRTLITFATSGDTIVIPAGTITLRLGHLLIGPIVLTIRGAGASATVIDGGGTDRVFDVIGSGVFGHADVTISGLTVQHGNPGPFGDGGGIHNEGVLRLIDVTVKGNTAGSGGGISSNVSFFGLALKLTNVTVSGNTASGGGGGISNVGGAILTNVTVSGNTAGAGGGGIVDGGVGGLLRLTNVTVSGNASMGGSGGGGILSFAATPDALNVIVSGNTASGGGDNCAGTRMHSLGHNIDSGNHYCPVVASDHRRNC